ncbi:hypothetical protein KKD37_02270 [Patescibacteria group bacterium]|nr:hypothetical protein [Patescibacteria group bacterium]
MKENINKPQPQPVEKRVTMDIYNFEETSNIPPAPGEPLYRDGYKWVPEKNIWDVDVSQSQTKRFEIMLEKDPNSLVSCVISKERQLDGFVQRLNERKEAERLAALNKK